MLKTVLFHPPCPKRAGTRLFPDLRSRLASVSTYRGERAGLGRLRVGRVKYRYASGACFTCGLVG